MQLRADFIVGLQSSNSWSGVYGFKPEDSIEPLELFAIIKLESVSSEERLEALAKMFLDELQNYLFNEGKESNYIFRLENAVWKMKSKMEILLSSDERYAQNGLDIEIALTLFDKDFLYLGVIGESKIFIKRGDKFVDLSKGLTDGNMMGFLRTGSLKLEEFDRLILATDSACKLGFGSIESAIDNLNIQSLSSLTSDKGVSVLLLGDENDSWMSQDDLTVEADTQEIEEDSQGLNTSARYIPIQNEDFEENKEEVELPINSEEETKSLNLVSLKEEIIDRQLQDSNNKTLFNHFSNKFTSRIKRFSSIRSSEGNNLKNDMEGISQAEEEPTARLDNTMFIDKVKYFIETVFQGVREFSSTKLLPFLKKSNKTYIKYLRDLFVLIINLLKKVFAWFKKEFIGGGLDDRKNIFEKARKRKRNRIILIILVVILGVLIINGINNRNSELKEQERVNNVKTSIDTYKSELDSLLRQSTSALDEAKRSSIVNQLDSLNSNLEIQKKEELFLEEISNYQETITKTKDKVLGVVGFTQPQLVADIGKIYSDSNPVDMVFTKGNLFVADKQRNAIYRVGTNISSQVTQFSTELNAPFTMTTNVAGDIIFYDTNSTSAIGKILVDQDGKVERFAGLAPAVIGTIAKAAVFSGNDSLYELRQNHQQIYKRDKAGDGYASGGAVYTTQNPPNWKTDPELGSAIDIDIPYEIYVLIRGKGLRRYLAGDVNTITNQTFVNTSKSDIDSLSSATAFDIDGKLLGVADPTNRRVLLFRIEDNDAKTLAYERAYVYRGNDPIFRNIKEIVINEQSKSIFVLDGTSIIRLDI